MKMMGGATEVEKVCSVDQIGETAGILWTYLNSHGEVPTSKVMREVNCSRDMLQRAVGWLAREDKVVLCKNGAAETMKLK